MIVPWSVPITFVAHGILAGSIRNIAVTSLVRGAGVSTFSRELAAAVARAGATAVLVDLSAFSTPPDPTKEHDQVAFGIFGSAPVMQPDGYDLVVIPRIPRTGLSWAGGLINSPMLEKALKEEFGAYDHVVLDLPDLQQEQPEIVTPWSVAAAVNVVFLVCLHDATNRAALVDAVQRLAQVGADKIEIVLNESDYTPASIDVAQAAGRVPRLRRYVERWMNRSSDLSR